MLSPPDRGDTGILAHMMVWPVPCMPAMSDAVHAIAHGPSSGARRARYDRGSAVARRRTDALGAGTLAQLRGEIGRKTMCTDARIASGQREMLSIEGLDEASRAVSCQTASPTSEAIQVFGVC